MAGLERQLQADPEYCRRVREVLARQRALARRTDAKAWQAYLNVEEAEVARWSYAVDQAARWAFQRGRRRRKQG